MPNNDELTTEGLALLSQSVSKRKQYLEQQEAVARKKEAQRREEHVSRQEEILAEVNPGLVTQGPGRGSSVVKSLKEQSVVRPYIPSVADAARGGLVVPAVEDYLWTIGSRDLTLPEGVELPEDPDALQIIAYAIFPAFLYEYGEKYKARYAGSIPASMIIRQWIQVMKESGGTKTGTVLPHELRFVVHRMASQGKGQDFNPRLMLQHAIDLRMSEKPEVKSMLATSVKETYERISGSDFFFYRTLIPAPSFEPSDWTTMTGYPTYFAFTDIPAATIQSLNRMIHYRFMTEPEFNPIMGRWLAKTMLTVIGIYIAEGKPLSANHIFSLAYRFSCSYISKVHPHDASFYYTAPKPKFVPPQD